MSDGGATSNGADNAKGEGKGKSNTNGKSRRRSTPPASAGKRSPRKKRRVDYNEDGDEEEAEECEDEETEYPSCSSKDLGDKIQCSFCYRWFHGSCVNLLMTEDHDDSLWFDDYACPACAKTGKVSTHKKDGEHLSLFSDTSLVDDVDLGELADVLWERLVHPNPHLVTATCRTVIAALSNRELLVKDLQAVGLIVGYLYHLMTPMGEQQMRQVFDFHADVMMENFMASRIRRRVWGLEQMDRMIAMTLKHRWHVKAYLVEGAGSPGCNGIYRMSVKDVEQVPLSAAFMADTQAPTYEREGGGFTLTRFSNARSQNPWCISKSARADRGTSGDMEAYSCQGPPQAEGSRPDRTGWETLVGGLLPPPTVTPVASEGYHCPQGREQDSLEWKLAKLMADNKFLEKLYLSSACVELVRKSNNIVSLYAKMCFLGGMEDTLTTEKIDIMWTSTLWQEAEFQDGKQVALCKVLVKSMKEMQPELVVHLIGRLQQGLDGEREWDRREDVLELLACLASDNGHGIIARNEEVRLATTQLVWCLLRDPAVLRHESCKPVSALLAFVKGRTDTDLATFLERCISSWQKLADHSDSIDAVRHVVENVDTKHIHQLALLFDIGPGVSLASDTDSVSDAAAPEGDDGGSGTAAVPKEVESFLDTLREGTCYVCTEPLLESLVTSVDTDMFGVLSWRCSCSMRGSKVHKAHSACLFGHTLHQSNQRLSCFQCKSSRTYGATRDGEGSGSVKLKIHIGDL